MSVSTIVTLGFGRSFSNVIFLPTLGYGALVPTPPDIPIGGAGHPATIDWQGKRKKATLADRPNEHLRRILDRAIAEYYAEIVEADLPQAVKKEAAVAVKPFADKQARFKSVPKPAEIDWIAVQKNADAVATILRIWSDELAQNEIDDDDETIMLLMH